MINNLRMDEKPFNLFNGTIMIKMELKVGLPIMEIKLNKEGSLELKLKTIKALILESFNLGKK